MGLKTVTVRVAEEKVAKLDALADAQQRDRSFLVNEAIDQYLSLQDYYIALIEEGIRADEADDVVPHSEVVRMIATMSRKAKKKTA